MLDQRAALDQRAVLDLRAVLDQKASLFIRPRSIETHHGDRTMSEAWIIDACRSPRGIGKPEKGALASMHPQHVAASGR
ncbi:MAG: hypothetical protein EBX66_01440 [Betaproteobacteria bacterium]|nr:hypothetical protein [Betaproteobacteria bacterium]